jgi:N-acetylmuramoyl-L-alanine amidase
METLIFCLALNVYMEARAEPVSGQYAVAEVTLRRARMERGPVCAVVFRDAQFSWTQYSDTLKVDNLLAWDAAVKVARAEVAAPTNYSKGATHFHATYVKPTWSKTLCVTTKIGQHIFYKDCEK